MFGCRTKHRNHWQIVLAHDGWTHSFTFNCLWFISYQFGRYYSLRSKTVLPLLPLERWKFLFWFFEFIYKTINVIISLLSIYIDFWPRGPLRPRQFQSPLIDFDVPHLSNCTQFESANSWFMRAKSIMGLHDWRKNYMAETLTVPNKQEVFGVSKVSAKYAFCWHVGCQAKKIKFQFFRTQVDFCLCLHIMHSRKQKV